MQFSHLLLFIVAKSFLSPMIFSMPSVAFRCPFKIDSNGQKGVDIDMEDENDHILEEDISWCLPRTYTMERPPFAAGKPYSYTVITKLDKTRHV